MKIVYRELGTQDDFKQCIDMQRDLFNLSDIDIVSPLILQLIARGNPSTGITLGAFQENIKKRELIGFILSFATFQKNSIYGAMIGVKPEYRNQGLGVNLFLKLREIAIRKGIFHFQGVYEPLEKNLAYLYINKLGFAGVQYLMDSSYEAESASGKILLDWDLKAFSSQNKNRNNLDNLTEYPIASFDYLPDSSSVLVEIPANFSSMEKENIEEARHWRQSTRIIFSHYINKHNYVIHDFLSFDENGVKKYFYLLKDQ